MWACPSCHAKVDDGFEVCWMCGTSAEGTEDPGFLTADDATPEDTPDDPAEAVGWGDEFGPELPEGPERPLNLVDCYWAKNVFDARHIADRLRERGIPAVADGDELRMGLTPAALGSPYFSPKVRVRAEDLPRARARIEAIQAERESGR